MSCFKTGFSICSLQHEHVWKLTSSLVYKNLDLDNFIVYVPDFEIQRFEEITDPRIEIRSQSSLDAGFFTPLQKLVVESGNLNRFGWYLQQFYKIQALIESDSDVTIIWDGDCVPVKKIKFLDENNVPLYMFAEEFHKPYFAAISRLLGMNRVQNQSFVIPGFPFLKDWVSEFVSEIENRHNGYQWYESILKTTDFSLLSGFSETETLGTWVANRKQTNWKSYSLNWERFGQSRFGYARNLSSDALIDLGKEFDLDIISFENWDISR